MSTLVLPQGTLRAAYAKEEAPRTPPPQASLRRKQALIDGEIHIVGPAQLAHSRPLKVSTAGAASIGPRDIGTKLANLLVGCRT